VSVPVLTRVIGVAHVPPPPGQRKKFGAKFAGESCKRKSPMFLGNWSDPAVGSG